MTSGLVSTAPPAEAAVPALEPAVDPLVAVVASLEPAVVPLLAVVSAVAIEPAVVAAESESSSLEQLAATSAPTANSPAIQVNRRDPTVRSSERHRSSPLMSLTTPEAWWCQPSVTSARARQEQKLAVGRPAIREVSRTDGEADDH